MSDPRQREARCVWLIPSEDPDARYLVPGCWERVQDWDAACTCPSTAAQLDEAEQKIAELEQKAPRDETYCSALRSVICRQPNARVLLEEVDVLYREWMAQRAAVEAANARGGA